MELPLSCTNPSTCNRLTCSKYHLITPMTWYNLAHQPYKYINIDTTVLMHLYGVMITGWESRIFWHSPKLDSILYSLYKIPLAQACFPLARPNFHSHWQALVSQPVITVTSHYQHKNKYLTYMHGVTVWLSSMLQCPTMEKGTLLRMPYNLTGINTWAGNDTSTSEQAVLLFTKIQYVSKWSTFCYVLCGLYFMILQTSFRVIQLALGQSYDCPNVSDATLKNMGKEITWIHREFDQNKTQHNKTVYIF